MLVVDSWAIACLDRKNQLSIHTESGLTGCWSDAKTFSDLDIEGWM